MIPITSVANNLLVEYYSRKICPQIEACGTIGGTVKTELIKQVKAVFVNRIGDIARNSFDNIVLSSFVGLVAVAVYDNYYYIYSALYGVMGIIVQSIRASIGNSIVKESIEKNYKDLLQFNFIFMWIVGWCTVCMFVLYQPFMNIWMKGNQTLILPFHDMVLFCLYFYVISMAYTKNAYLEAKGLFHESRHLYILEAAGNLVLNIVLCKLFGTTGILIATVLTIFFFNFFGGTFVLFRYYFKRDCKQFLCHHIVYFIATIINGCITYWVCSLFTINGMIGIVIRIVLCLSIPNILYLLEYSMFPQRKGMMQVLKRMKGR